MSPNFGGCLLLSSRERRNGQIVYKRSLSGFLEGNALFGCLNFESGRGQRFPSVCRYYDVFPVVSFDLNFIVHLNNVELCIDLKFVYMNSYKE